MCCVCYLLVIDFSNIILPYFVRDVSMVVLGKLETVSVFIHVCVNFCKCLKIIFVPSSGCIYNRCIGLKLMLGYLNPLSNSLNRWFLRYMLPVCHFQFLLIVLHFAWLRLEWNVLFSKGWLFALHDLLSLLPSSLLPQPTKSGTLKSKKKLYDFYQDEGDLPHWSLSIGNCKMELLIF